MPIDVGDRIADKYRITRLLGSGGMGSVFEGVHELVHRPVAIKVLHAHVSRDESMVRRFEREAQAAGRIGSRHIVEVLDVGSLDGGERYMVMEYLDGESLSARLKREGRLPDRVVVELALQLLDGLAAAHDAGIVHRDLKPANVHLTPGDTSDYDYVKLLDFGVSKFNVLDADGVTDTGAIIGTPHYISPEQLKDPRNADERSDIYSVGVMLFRALAGRLPFAGETVHQLFMQLITEETPSLASVAKEVDPLLAAIVQKAIDRDPAARYATAGDFAEALRSWLEARGIEPRRALPGARPSLREPIVTRDEPSAPGQQGQPGPDAGDAPSIDTHYDATSASAARSRGRGMVALAAAALVLGAGAVLLLRASGAGEVAAPAVTALDSDTRAPLASGSEPMASAASPGVAAGPSGEPTTSTGAPTPGATSRRRAAASPPAPPQTSGAASAKSPAPRPSATPVTPFDVPPSDKSAEPPKKNDPPPDKKVSGRRIRTDLD